MITVNFDDHYAGGFVCVHDSNACGASPTTCKNVPLLTSKPSKPKITGFKKVCAPSTQTYCATSTQATSYNWVVDHGMIILSGQGTSCITVSIPSGYDNAGRVKVRGVSCKGTSDEAKIDIRLTTPLTSPPTFCIANSNDNHTSICVPSTDEYEICLLPNAECYTWTAPAGCVIHDRNGHAGNPLTVCSGNQNDVDIDFPSGFTSGNVTVSASNGCNSTGSSSLTVTGHPCRIAGGLSVEAAGLNAYPNPTTGKLNICSFSFDT